MTVTLSGLPLSGPLGKIAHCFAMVSTGLYNVESMSCFILAPAHLHRIDQTKTMLKEEFIEDILLPQKESGSLAHRTPRS